MDRRTIDNVDDIGDDIASMEEIVAAATRAADDYDVKEPTPKKRRKAERVDEAKAEGVDEAKAEGVDEAKAERVDEAKHDSQRHSFTDF